VNTIYDVMTLVLFAGLAILFLQRSTEPETPKDRIYHYAPPAVGCAIANWLGNHSQDIAALVVIAVVLGYSLFVLKPFGRKS
jgi:hypothetical protein